MIKRKSFVFPILLTAGLLLPISLDAQEQSRQGGLFGGPSSNSSNGMLGRGPSGGYNLSNQTFGSGTEGGYELSNQTFGQETPVGCGIAILMMAGVGYAVMKSRKKNQKSN